LPTSDRFKVCGTRKEVEKFIQHYADHRMMLSMRLMEL